jgi:hypothetical protein
VNALAIRSLLDQARDLFVGKCGHESWREISTKFGVREAKTKMANGLESKDWGGIDPQQLINFVVDSKLRRPGNTSAHHFTKEEIKGAINHSGDQETHLRILNTLYDKLYL